MAFFRVKASRLNVRTSPVEDFKDDSSIIGKLAKDAPFESINQKENKLGEWFQDKNSHWVWGGGLASFSEPQSPSINTLDYFNLSFIPEKMSWAHEYLEIPFIWKNLRTAGRNVVVGVIDTGIDVLNEDLQTSFSQSSTRIDHNGIEDKSPELIKKIQDVSGHGTQMAGIIAAKGNNVYGISPEATILVIKLDGGLNTSVSIAKSIEYMIEQKVDLISISQSCFDSDLLRDAVTSAVNLSIPIFASIGNLHVNLFEIDEDSFPACCEGCTAVGAFDENKNVCSFSQRNSHLAFLAPGSIGSILTASINSNTPIKCEGMTSIATAISAACFALIVSFLKKNGRIDLKKKALEIFTTSCDDMGIVIGRDADHGFGRINLRKSISLIKLLI